VRAQREPPLRQVLGPGQAAAGELLDLPDPVTEGLLVHMQGSGGQLPGPVAVEHGAQRRHVVAAMLSIVREQRPEYLRHQHPGLGRGPGQQQRGLVPVPDQRPAFRLGSAQRPPRFLRRLRHAGDRPDPGAAAGRPGRRSARLGRRPADVGGRQPVRQQTVRQQQVEQLVPAEQQVRSAAPVQPAVQPQRGTRRPCAEQAKHAGGQVESRLGQPRPGQPLVDRPVEQLAEQLGA
jgi:hypothetical protein